MPEAEVPQRIWAVIGHADAVSGGAIWATFDTREGAERYPGPRMMEMMPRIVIEYVPASALSDAWDTAIKTLIRAADECPVFVYHSARGREFLIEALEAARDAALSAGKESDG